MGLNAILGKISFYWQYPFVRYALVVGVLIALCSSLLGVTLVLRRFSFIGDGLSHVAFGAMTIATVLKMTEKMPLIMGITIGKCCAAASNWTEHKNQGRCHDGDDFSWRTCNRLLDYESLLNSGKFIW